MANGLEYGRAGPGIQTLPERGRERVSDVAETVGKNPDGVAAALRSDPRTESVMSEALGKEPVKDSDRNPESYSEDPDVRVVQESLYSGLGIDVKTDSNGPFKKFSKGAVDGLVVGNAELMARIAKKGPGKFLSELKAQLTTFEGWKKIAEALGKSVTELFSGDAYRTGKSVAELGLVTTGAGAAGWGLKKAAGTAFRAAELAEKGAAKTVLRTAGNTLDATGTVLQMPAKALGKAAEAAGKWAKAVGEAAGANRALKYGTETGKEALEKTWVSGTVRKTKEAVKGALGALGTVHFAGSAEGFPKHPKTAEAGSLFPEGKPGPETATRKEANDAGIAVAEAEILKASAAVYERYPDLKAHKEFFKELKDSDVLGEGLNGIIVRHPERSELVVKIPKSGKVDDLAKEYESIQAFYSVLKKGKEQYPGKLSGNVLIPEVQWMPSKSGGYMLMEKIEGQNLNTKFYREYHEKTLAEKYPKERLDAMTDGEFDKAMKESWLEKVPTPPLAENDYSGRLMHQSLRKFHDQRLYQTELGNVLDYLEWKGYRHEDLINNPGNVMVDKNGKNYIIDFWRVTIRPTGR